MYHFLFSIISVGSIKNIFEFKGSESTRVTVLSTGGKAEAVIFLGRGTKISALIFEVNKMFPLFQR